MTCTSRRATLAAVLIASSVVALAAPRISESDRITGSRLRAHLEFIAHDLLEGRDTPSRGLDIAAEYLRAQLTLWGLKPGGDDGTFFHTVRLRQPVGIAEGTSLEVAGKQFLQGVDLLANKQSAGSARGELVFVGRGWRIPELKVDPYAGIDVKGKVLLVLGGQRTGFGMRERRGPLGKAAEAPLEAARRLGAVGILTVPTSTTLDVWSSLAASFGRPGSVAVAGDAGLPSGTVSKAALAAMLAGSDLTPDGLVETSESGKDLPSRTLAVPVRLTVAVDARETLTKNVVAIREGSDPKLKNEYVAVGAHYDHIGMRTTGTGDRIFNGADDDGSGTVAVLEMAHAFAAAKAPKRSILFVWHTGEEKGLWGSRAFTERPTVPIGSIVAQLNIDMIGRSKAPGDTQPRNANLTGPEAIYVVGSRRLSKELGDLVQAVNGKMYKLAYDPKYDAPNDPENIYGRSDHANYARLGIPIAFWFDGVHVDYHQVGDEVSKIDFVKMEKVARTIYATAWELAQRSSRPKVDGVVPGEPEDH